MLKKKKIYHVNFLLGIAVGIVIALIIGGVIFFIFNYQKQDKIELEVSDQQSTSSQEIQKTYTFDISPADHIYGDYDSPVTLVVFSDLECSFSADFHNNSIRLASQPEYQGKVRIIWRHFPLDSIHPQARPAAVASECAAQQGKFWDFIQEVLNNQDKLASDFYLQTAEELELNIEQFKVCLDEQLTRDIIEAHYQTGWAKGVRGTPISFINGQMFKGAISYLELKSIVDEDL